MGQVAAERGKDHNRRSYHGHQEAGKAARGSQACPKLLGNLLTKQKSSLTPTQNKVSE